MIKPINLILIFTGVAFVVLLVIAQIRGCRIADQREIDAQRLQKLTDHCHAVSVALEQDARELAGDDPGQQAVAADRFGGAVTYHSEQEMLLCARGPLHIELRDACWLRRDYQCLRDLATQAAAVTKPP